MQTHDRARERNGVTRTPYTLRTVGADLCGAPGIAQIGPQVATPAAAAVVRCRGLVRATWNARLCADAAAIPAYTHVRFNVIHTLKRTENIIYHFTRTRRSRV